MVNTEVLQSKLLQPIVRVGKGRHTATVPDAASPHQGPGTGTNDATGWPQAHPHPQWLTGAECHQ